MRERINDWPSAIRCRVIGHLPRPPVWNFLPN
jgi:hypothetical protein